jgi:acyl dehydratase
MQAARRAFHVCGTLGSLSGSTSVAPIEGAWAEGTRRFEAADCAAFASLTHDHNVIHRLGSAISPNPIAHGLLVASTYPALFSLAYPGAVYRSQSLKFLRPIPVGSLVTSRIEVQRVRTLRGGVAGKVTTCYNKCRCAFKKCKFMCACKGILVVCSTKSLLGSTVAIEGLAQVLIPPSTPPSPAPSS